MFKRSRISIAAAMVVGSMASVGAMAQSAQRVEITGSAIKRIDAETSVPVTILKIEELKAQGVTSIEQIMNSLGAVQTTQTSSQQVGAGTGGASFADLRGIGPSKTLVLLNGRRIANNAIDGSATDLNMIPFAALQRVEVLRDGASSLYGTDAIGGVINFITRNDYQGGSISLGADSPEASGGKSRNANVGFGFGNLATQGFNVFGFIDINQQDPIGGLERPFNARFPGGISPTPFPANYYQTGDIVANPAALGCSSPAFLTPAGDGTSCQIKTASFVDYTPKSERKSAMLRGSLRLGAEHTLSVEWFGTQNDTTTRIAPVPYGLLYMNKTRPDGSANPFYPGNPGSTVTPGFALDPTYVGAGLNPRAGVVLQPGYIFVKWRALDGGSRTDISSNKQQRLLANLDGVIAGWDYQAGVSYNENKIAQNVTGYSNGTKITQGVLNGVINPFGAQTAAGAAAIADALLGGNLQNHSGKVTALDGRASRELGDWFGSGRNAAIAVGAEFRHEDFLSAANPPVAELLVASTGVDPTSVSAGKRNISAFYGELSVPMAKGLDATVAMRYDKYSDFGDTLNPKIALRYQPMKELLLRASYSTGFRAPSLYELNATQSFTNTGTLNDPINCPGGVPIAGKSKVLNCKAQFQRLTGGNLALQPEKSKTFNLGIVLEPVADVSLGVDLWWIRLTDHIGALASATVFGDVATFGSVFKRNATGDLSIDGSSCPGVNCGYVDLRQLNLGATNTNGFDLSANFRRSLGEMGKLSLTLTGTYVTNYEYQDIKGGPFNKPVGVYVGLNPVFRLQHTATATWALGNWTFGAAGHYKSGYVDADPSNTVSSYATMDAYVNWVAMKGLSLTFGVNNLTNTDPPYSNQTEVFQANYDPRFSDPTGRKYYMRASYQF